MFSSRFICLVFLALFISGYYASINVDWFTSYGSAENESVTASCYDSQGNYYLAGEFKGTLQLGSFTLTSGIHSAIFIAKYSASGQLLWAKNSTSSGATARSASVTGIVADNNGNLYLCGSFIGTFKLSDVTVQSSSFIDSYLTKLDANGICLWTNKANASGANKAFDIALTSDGYPVICGNFSQTSLLFGYNVSNASLEDAYVARFDSDGSLQTLKHWGSTQTDQCQAITSLSNGEYIISGYNSNSITFGTTTLPAHGMESYVCKLDSSLNPIWAKGSICDGGSQSETTVTADASGIYVFGRYNAAMAWSTFSLPNSGYALFSMKLDHSGNVLWLNKLLSSSSNRSVTEACILANGDVVLTGFFNGTCSYASGTYTSAGLNDAFLISLSPTGEMKMFQPFGGSGSDVGFTISKNSNDQMLCAGYFGAANSSILGTIPQHIGLYDMYAFRFSIQDASIPSAPQSLMLQSVNQQYVLSWSAVQTSQTGSPISVSGYQIFGSSGVDGESFELIGECTGTSYVLPVNELSYSHRFYMVKALR